MSKSPPKLPDRLQWSQNSFGHSPSQSSAEKLPNFSFHLNFLFQKIHSFNPSTKPNFKNKKSNRRMQNLFPPLLNKNKQQKMHIMYIKEQQTHIQRFLDIGKTKANLGIIIQIRRFLNDGMVEFLGARNNHHTGNSITSINPLSLSLDRS